MAHLAVLGGNEVVYAGRVQGFRAPTTVSDVGVRLPAHLTATGRAMLAALPRAQVRALYPDRGALTLFASRTLRFLANELTVPAPVTPGASVPAVAAS